MPIQLTRGPRRDVYPTVSCRAGRSRLASWNRAPARPLAGVSELAGETGEKKLPTDASPLAGQVADAVGPGGAGPARRGLGASPAACGGELEGTSLDARRRAPQPWVPRVRAEEWGPRWHWHGSGSWC